MAKKSGSEKRVRSVQVGVRLTPKEYQIIKYEADLLGMSVARFLRECALDDILTAGGI